MCNNKCKFWLENKLNFENIFVFLLDEGIKILEVCSAVIKTKINFHSNGKNTGISAPDLL